jgi:GNAT superfamily N-acetyltransferase
MIGTAPVSKPFPKVRRAKREDVPQIFELGRLLFEENAITGWSEHRIVEAVDRAIDGNGAVIGVIGDVGRLEGMIYLFVAKFWYTDDVHLEEVYNYVHPNYRKSDNAKALIDFAKMCSEGIKVPLMIGIVSNHKTEQKIRLYQRRLGKPSGAYWLVNGKTGK